MKSSGTNIGHPILFTLILILLAGCGKEQGTQPEMRGVWLHPGLFSLDENIAVKQIDSLFDAYREIGIVKSIT
ncbi:MAG: hypothetical protein NTZ85_04005 [Bacteroidia bacterium]|nr:hypothetical protein [Bacteroidia bacterium]